MLILRLILLKLIVLGISVAVIKSLKCRTEDGPSDGELKRVARSCMRKFGDAAFAQNSQQLHQQMQHFQQQQQQLQQNQQTQGRYRVTNRDNYGYNYESGEEENSDFDDDHYYNNNKNNNDNNSNNNNNNRNYQRQQNAYNNNNYYRGGHAGNNNDENQRNRVFHSDNKQNRTNMGNDNTNWNHSNQKGKNNNNNNSNNNNYNNMNKNNNQNNSFSDVACIAHCFFNEMNMLNNNDYPDRHKMLYILTKDLRDRELRNFYTDTLQECFRYLENQRRRDKCQFSRELITCMTEYAKGNCDDWNEFNMVFN